MENTLVYMKDIIRNYLVEKYGEEFTDISFMDDMDIHSLYLELFLNDKLCNEN